MIVNIIITEVGITDHTGKVILTLLQQIACYYIQRVSYIIIVISIM